MFVILINTAAGLLTCKINGYVDAARCLTVITHIQTLYVYYCENILFKNQVMLVSGK